jgi:hypothetical protein
VTVALQVDFVDPATGAHLTLSTNYVDATVALFYNQRTARAGRNPVFTFPQFTLSADEVTAPNPAFVQALVELVQAGQINSPKDALTACLYVLLKARAEFSGAADV